MKYRFVGHTRIFCPAVSNEPYNLPFKFVFFKPIATKYIQNNFPTNSINLKIIFQFLLCSLLYSVMAAPQLLFTGGLVASYPHSVPLRFLIPSGPYAFAAGYDAIDSYEPMEQHGYRIAY